MTTDTRTFVLDALAEERLDVTVDDTLRLFGARLVRWPDLENRSHTVLVDHVDGVEATLGRCVAFLSLPVVEIPAGELVAGDWYQWYGTWKRSTIIEPGLMRGDPLYVMHDTGSADRIPTVQEIAAVRSATWRHVRSTSTYIDGFEDGRDLWLYLPDHDDERRDEALHAESGAGHFAPDGRSVDAYYEIESIDGVEPRIHWEATG